MNKNVRLGLFFACSISVPYIYYVFLRPKLMEFEEKFDQKVTNISDRDLEKMKLKMEEMKRNKKD